jgi:transposase
MAKKRRRYTPEFKAKIALEALMEQRTIQELSVQYELHPNLISKWKKELHERASELFSESKKPAESDTQSTGDLYKQIGRLQVENEWLKKSLSR